jgi:hypothetical protein
MKYLSLFKHVIILLYFQNSYSFMTKQLFSKDFYLVLKEDETSIRLFENSYILFYDNVSPDDKWVHFALSINNDNNLSLLDEEFLRVPIYRMSSFKKDFTFEVGKDFKKFKNFDFPIHLGRIELIKGSDLLEYCFYRNVNINKDEGSIETYMFKKYCLIMPIEAFVDSQKKNMFISVLKYAELYTKIDLYVNFF